MPLRVIDDRGQSYEFDDTQKEFVKRLLKEALDLRLKLIEMEFHKRVAECKLRSARQENDEIVLAAITPLDSDNFR